MTAPAPLFADMAEGPPGGRAEWVRAADGVRLRAGHWPAPAPSRGTVFLLPGRAEFIEKYGRTAADLAARGFDTASLDWRGQGLSDRAPSSPRNGHVGAFGEYQRDMAALLDLARERDLPRPWFLLAHSMGGTIGLRCLMGPHPFAAAVFSAPMWGVLMAPWLGPVAVAVSTAARWLNLDAARTPGTRRISYVLSQGFAGNLLTSDPESWDHMCRQALDHPEMALAGPSLGWLRAALDECRALASLPSPDLPVLTVLGTGEKIVEVGPIHDRMSRWPKGRLSLYPGAEHEIPMERPATRARFADEVAALFSAQR